MSKDSVVEASKKLVTMYADATDRQNPSQAYFVYKVKRIPQVWFVNGEGKKIETMSGFVPTNKLIKKINEVVDNYKP